VVILEPGEDPADCVTRGGTEAFERALKGARDALEFKWSQTLSVFRAGGQRTKRDAIDEFVRFVASTTVAGGMDAVQQNLLNDRLSELLGVPPAEVFDLLSRAKRAAQRGSRPEDDPSRGVSDYDATLRGVPVSLVPVTETVFGHLLTNPGCWELVDDAVAQAVNHSETWSRLYRVLLDVHADMGEYSIQDVMTHCDDGALCELVGRARARVEGLASSEDFGAARDHLASELSVLRWGQLREDLRQGGGHDDEVFRLLRESARGQDSFLPSETRCNATPTS